jgi:hypothetical protein
MERRNERLILKEDEVIDGASRRRPGGELMPVDPDDAASAPFSDLRGSAADSPTRTGYQQCFAWGECGVFDNAQPGGEISDTNGTCLLEGESRGLATQACNRDGD